MTRTHSTTLIAVGLVGLVVGFLMELGYAATGHAVFVPPLSLPLALVVIAIIVLAFAVPIRRSVTGRSRERINPFRAMRVAALAKASSLAGGVLLGVTIGILLYLLSRTAIPAIGSIWLTVGSAVAAAVLMAAGLVAEFFCTIPPADDDTDEMKEARA
jgi:dolichol kinase